MAAAGRNYGQGWITPVVTDAEQARLERAQRTPKHPRAVVVIAPQEGERVYETGWPTVVRLAPAPGGPIPDSVFRAWAASPGVAAALEAAGWPAEAVDVLPPAIDAAPTAGEGSVVMLLPSHEPELARATLQAAARAWSGADLEVHWSVANDRLVELARHELPGAWVCERAPSPVTLAGALAAAGTLIALDPDDTFQRRLLTAAGHGAAVVGRSGGPAEWVLGDRLHAPASLTVEAIADAIAAARAGGDALRAERSALVTQVCGREAIAARLAEMLPRLPDTRRHRRRPATTPAAPTALVVCPTPPHPGTERRADVLVTDLRASGVDVTVLADRTIGFEEALDRLAAIQVEVCGRDRLGDPAVLLRRGFDRVWLLSFAASADIVAYTRIHSPGTEIVQDAGGLTSLAGEELLAAIEVCRAADRVCMGEAGEIDAVRALLEPVVVEPAA